MAQLRLSFTALRALEVLARQESLTSAARELKVTPSAVSQQLSTLERRLGVALVERRGGAPVRLTEAGRGYARSLRRAFRQIARATAALATPQPADVSAPSASEPAALPALVLAE